MGTLIENAQKHIASMAKELEGDDDFMPFMTVRGRDDDGIVYVGLMMPDGGEEKDHIADVMMAVCAVHRAVEVVFASTSWSVTVPAKDSWIRDTSSSNRTEVVFLHAVDSDGDQFHSARVTRENNVVILGDWSSDKVFGVGGRFGKAIHMGIDLGKQLPPEMCAFVDHEMAEGRGDEVIATWLRALRTARSEISAEYDAAKRN